MKKLYFISAIVIAFYNLIPIKISAQCAALTADIQVYESRCAATGAIKITAGGGSGNYNYRVSGPVNINLTSADSITGLSTGDYTVEVVDIDSKCRLTVSDIHVPGDYSDPRFTLQTGNIYCENGFSGTISVENIERGRQPMAFSIVSPSPMGVGTTNGTGIFTSLKAGDYSIRLTDSCGGIQTRTVSVEDYTWNIVSANFTKFSCDSASGWIEVVDSKGNTSTTTGIFGMFYGIVVNGTDTVWSDNPHFRFKVGPDVKSVKAIAKDACGTKKSITASMFLTISVDSDIAVSDKECSTFTASVTGIKNFFDPDFCLYDEDDHELDCNSTGIFPGLSYGSYCIRARDACADTVISRCFTVLQAVPGLDEDVLIGNKTCNTFDAQVTGQVNLTDPFYYLYDEANVLIDFNTNGIFTGLSYGDYCIFTHDNCTDTTIVRCFSVGPPQPVVPEIITPSYVTCQYFGLELGGDSLYNPVYCLIDELGNTIACNNDGIFDDILLGSYCVTIYDECRDTTIQRCFTVGPPQATNDMSAEKENKACSTFTAKIKTILLSGSEFSLYDSDSLFIESNNTGIFDNLPYGSYYVTATPACPDTTLFVDFEETAPVPFVDATLKVTDRACSTFQASVTGQTNLTDPVYYLTDQDSGDTLDFNTNGIFPGLAYGGYCILVKDGCLDTTLQVCGLVAPPDFKLTATASRSCNYGTSLFNLSFSSYPVEYSIYDPLGVLIRSGFVSSGTSVDSIPDLPDGEQYRILAKDACDNADSLMLAPVIAWVRHGGNVTQKCPGGGWADGSGNINAVATTNTGYLTVRIIKKDNVTLSPYLVPDIVNYDSVFVFQDLGPGSYIVGYNTNDGCNNYFYDTITINPYQYPNLSKSSAYQCDVNGFSVGAVVTNGVGPFTYEIIGSTPAAPSIIAGPQSNPVFTIDNGYNYSLIRLRALDACGNATLGDASILPLANSGINVSENCIGTGTILSIDTIYNSMVTWMYQKDKSEDSVYLGTGFQWDIDLLTDQDTGYYYAKIDLNSGCIVRNYQVHLTGNCYPVLPVIQVEFTGNYMNNQAHLSWSIRNDLGLKRIIVERKDGDNYQSIGSVDPKEYVSPGQYRFIDKQPLADNYYRLRIEMQSDKIIYSKVIHLNSPTGTTVRIYPNPATDFVTVEPGFMNNVFWEIEMINSVSQRTVLKEKTSARQYLIRRTPGMASGLYLLKLTNLKTGITTYERVIFSSNK